MPGDDLTSVVPAQLSYLTIYNPLLGPTDETIQDQIVFYTSRAARLRRREDSAAGIDDNEPNGEHNEKLRQIGLAQGMVSFARWELLTNCGKSCAEQIFQELYAGKTGGIHRNGEDNHCTS